MRQNDTNKDRAMAGLLCATYSVEEAAQVLGISRNAAYRAAESGPLAGIALRLGRRILIPREALRRLLAGETVVTTREPEVDRAIT